MIMSPLCESFHFDEKRKHEVCELKRPLRRTRKAPCVGEMGVAVQVGL